MNWSALGGSDCLSCLPTKSPPPDWQPILFPPARRLTPRAVVTGPSVFFFDRTDLQAIYKHRHV